MRHAQRLQVVGQGSEVPGHRPEGTDLGEELPGFLATADGTLNPLEMHVQPGYLKKQRVHGAPPKEAAVGNVEELNNLLRVLPNRWGQQFRVRVDVRARLSHGLINTKIGRPLTDGG